MCANGEKTSPGRAKNIFIPEETGEFENERNAGRISIRLLSILFILGSIDGSMNHGREPFHSPSFEI